MVDLVSTKILFYLLFLHIVEFVQQKHKVQNLHDLLQKHYVLMDFLDILILKGRAKIIIVVIFDLVLAGFFKTLNSKYYVEFIII